jgi:hypothetical protein
MGSQIAVAAAVAVAVAVAAPVAMAVPLAVAATVAAAVAAVVAAAVAAALAVAVAVAVAGQPQRQLATKATASHTQTQQKTHAPSTPNECSSKCCSIKCVSSARGDRLRNQMSSHLRDTVIFFTKCRLVYAKHSLREAIKSCTQASPAEPSQHEHTKNSSRLRETVVFQNGAQKIGSRRRETSTWKITCRLTYAKQYLFL